MNRIEITDDVRRLADSASPMNILSITPRHIIAIVDKQNEIIDAINWITDELSKRPTLDTLHWILNKLRDRPKEISHDELMRVLNGTV